MNNLLNLTSYNKKVYRLHALYVIWGSISHKEVTQCRLFPYIDVSHITLVAHLVWTQFLCKALLVRIRLSNASIYRTYQKNTKKILFRNERYAELRRKAGVCAMQPVERMSSGNRCDSHRVSASEAKSLFLRILTAKYRMACLACLASDLLNDFDQFSVRSNFKFCSFLRHKPSCPLHYILRARISHDADTSISINCG